MSPALICSPSRARESIGGCHLAGHPGIQSFNGHGRLVPISQLANPGSMPACPTHPREEGEKNRMSDRRQTRGGRGGSSATQGRAASRASDSCPPCCCVVAMRLGTRCKGSTAQHSVTHRRIDASQHSTSQQATRNVSATISRRSRDSLLVGQTHGHTDAQSGTWPPPTDKHDHAPSVPEILSVSAFFAGFRHWSEAGLGRQSAVLPLNGEQPGGGTLLGLSARRAPLTIQPATIPNQRNKTHGDDWERDFGSVSAESGLLGGKPT